MSAPLQRRPQAMRLDLRTSGTDVRLVGYASVFSQPYDMGSFREQVAPGAFTTTLEGNPDVRLLVDHDGQPLARTKSGTLKLSQDSRGLRVEAHLDPTDPDVQRLMPKMRRGDLDQMSFAFRVPAGGDSWSEDYSVRTIRTVDLQGGDVSVVTYPASPTTSVQLEALAARAAARLHGRTTIEQARRIAQSLGR